MRKTIAVIGITSLLSIGMAGMAQAAPIDCPGSQTATKTSSGWDCVNKAGNGTNAENPKNPNVRKGFF
jgi:hypothetical protein